MKKLFIALFVSVLAVLVIAQTKFPGTIAIKQGATINYVLVALDTNNGVAMWTNELFIPIINVSTGNFAYINLTNALGSNQVRLAITNLTDVSVPARAEGDTLFWNPTMFKWTNGQPAGGVAPGGIFDIPFNNGADVFVAAAASTFRYISTAYQIQLADPDGGGAGVPGELTLDGAGFISQSVGGDAGLAFGIGARTNLLINPRGAVIVRPDTGIGTNLFQVEYTNQVPILTVSSNGSVGINTNSTISALHVVSKMPTNPSIVRIDETNGAPKFHFGSLNGAPTFSAIWGPVVPSGVNYLIANDSGTTAIQGTSISLNSGANGRWTVDTSGHFVGGSAQRVHFGGSTAAFPAIGRTNGHVAVIGAGGTFAGANTNGLWVMGGPIIQDFTLIAPAAPTRQGTLFWNDGTNVCVVLRNEVGTITTNKLSMTAWP